MTRSVLFVALILAIFLSAPLTFAGITKEIPFSGTLKATQGNKSLTTTVDMVFRIYGTPTGGVPLWEGNYTQANGNPVSIKDGAFSVMLGSGTGNDLSLSFTEETYYLGVTVGTDSEMAPREKLGATAFAFTALTLDGKSATDFYARDTQLFLSTSTSDALIQVTQSGIGDFLRFTDEIGTEVVSVQKTGNVRATSFESTGDIKNTILGWFEVSGSQPSLFQAGVSLSDRLTVTDGNGVSFGNGSGVYVYQDASVPSGIADLIFDGVGPNETGYVNFTSPYGMLITPNNFDGCTTGCAPTIKLEETGRAEISNMGYGDPGNQILELNFTDGVRIGAGELHVTEGNVTLETGSMRLENGILQVDSLAPDMGTVALEVDTSGTIMPAVSDMRFKKNVRTIHNATSLIQDLRGVRYEWIDEDRFGTSTEIGFIAQEVEEVLPEVVRDTGSYLSLNTKNIVAVLVEGFKELYERVTTYEDRTRALEAEVRILREEIEMLKVDRGIETSRGDEEDSEGEGVVSTETTTSLETAEVSEESGEIAPLTEEVATP